MTRPASLGMYDMPALHRANDALWSAIATRLRAAGLDDVPDRLDRTRPIGDIWRDPALLLAQTCGYPLVTVLDGIAEPVAVPVYGWPGCDGARHCSLLVVPAASSFEALVQLRGRRAAFNGHDSNTGMNLFRHAVAPLAKGEAFFAATIETGSHLASLDRVASGDADIAAIDCVTFGQAMRHDPQRTAGVRSHRANGQRAGPALRHTARHNGSRDRGAARGDRGRAGRPRPCPSSAGTRAAGYRADRTRGLPGTARL